MFTYNPPAGTLLSVGTQTLSVTFTPTDLADYDAATITVSLMVNPALTMTALAANTTSLLPGAQLTLTATVSGSSGISGAPGGVVTFSDGNSVLGNANLSAAGVATFSPSGLGVGAHTFSASYSGDSNDARSSSSAITVTISDFTLPASPTSPISVDRGQTATTKIAVTPISGFTGTISFTCAVPTSMLEASCSATSVQLTGSSPAISTLTVTTNAPHPASAAQRATAWTAFPCGLLIPAMVLMSSKTKKSKKSFLLAVLFLLLIGLMSCGGGSASSSQVNTDLGTPAGSYNLTLTAVSGADSHTMTIPVSVQ